MKILQKFFTVSEFMFRDIFLYAINFTFVKCRDIIFEVYFFVLRGEF